MSAAKVRSISQTEYLLDAIRHIETVARVAQEAFDVGPGLKETLPLRIFGRGCRTARLPRPFNRGCAAVDDVIRDVEETKAAAAPARRTPRSRRKPRR